MTGVSLLLNVILAGALFVHRPETKTVLVTPSMTKLDVEGPAYYRRLAIDAARLMGDVTPSTVDASHATLLTMTSAENYAALASALSNEAVRLKKLSQSYVFTPALATVDVGNGRAAVAGTRLTIMGNAVIAREELAYFIRFDTQETPGLVEKVVVERFKGEDAKSLSQAASEALP